MREAIVPSPAASPVSAFVAMLIGLAAGLVALTFASPAKAVVLVDLALNATQRPYGPTNPVNALQQKFSVPDGKGMLVMTYIEEDYVGGPGGFNLDPVDLSSEHIGWGGSTEYTPRNPLPGQPYRVQTIWRTDFSRKMWLATLTARHAYQAYQVRDRGQQIASRQRLVIEFFPGAAPDFQPPVPGATSSSAPPVALPGLPSGADQFDSTSRVVGDPFNGGEWSNARNQSAFATRTLGHPVCINGLTLNSAGSDMSTRGSTIRITLSGPSGSHVVLDLSEVAINRPFSPGGSGNVVPAQSRSFDPVEASRVEVSMAGSGWFLMSGLRFSVVPCP